MDQLYSKNKTTIVVVTFLSDSIIDKCIENLGNKYKIIVVENSNRRSFKEYIENKFKNIECHLMGYDAGYPKAANYGVSLVKSDYVFLINPDTFPTSKCVEKLESFADIKKECPLIFPITIRENNKISSDFGYFDGKKIENINVEEIKIDYSNGNAIFLRKLFFENQNIFDDNIFLQYDDTELCWRLKKLNIDIYMLTNATVKHLEGQSHEKKFDFELKKEVWWHNGWSHIYLAKKHFSYSKLTMIAFKKLFLSLTKSIICLILFKKKSSKLYFLNFYGTVCSIINTKAFYRSKINFN